MRSRPIRQLHASNASGDNSRPRCYGPKLNAGSVLGIVLWGALCLAHSACEGDSEPVDSNPLSQISGEADEAQSPNDAPVGGSLSIVPRDARETDLLRCVATGASDPQDDPIRWQYRWRINGSTADGQDSDTLSGTHFNKYDSVACLATPSDGQHVGATLVSSAVTIQNTLPTISDATITLVDDQTLRCGYHGWNDPDPADQASAEYRWMRYPSPDTEESIPDANTETLPLGEETARMIVACEVTPLNGLERGDSVTSQRIDLSEKNQAPTLESVILVPDPAFSDSTLTCVPKGFSDPDGDDPSYRYAWYKNDELVNDASHATLSGNFALGDIISCTVTPGDGLLTGVAKSSSARTISPTTPSLAGAVVSPSAGTWCEAYTCTPQFHDPDGFGTPSVSLFWQQNDVALSITEPTLSDADLSPGDVLNCVMTVTEPNHPAKDLPITSNAVTIINNPPTLDSVSITPTNAPVGKVLQCLPHGFSDAECEPTPQYQYRWFSNGILIPTASDEFYDTDGLEAGTSMVCEIIPNDGYALGQAVISNPVVLTDATLPEVSLQLPEGEGDPLRCLVTTELDAEATIQWLWQIGDDTEFEGQEALPSTLFKSCDRIRCRVTISTGNSTVSSNINEVILPVGPGCDDGSDCTLKSCAQQGGCVHSPVLGCGEEDGWTDPSAEAEMRELLRLSLRFYGAQRCGDNHNWLLTNNPAGDACHLEDGPDYAPNLDMRGGWHDAGDHIKFTRTIAWAAYSLLKGYEVFPQSFEDNDSPTYDGTPNGIPDLLDEVRVGTDYLLKAHPDPDTLITRVGGDQDHDSWFTSPYQSTLDKGSGGGARPVFFGGQADIAGTAAAALALMSVLYAPHDEDYALSCLEAARSLYTLAELRPGSTPTDAPYYEDPSGDDALLCGAIELHRATGDQAFLSTAIALHDNLGPHGWVVGWAHGHDYCRHSLVVAGHSQALTVWGEDVNRYLEQVSTEEHVDGIAYFSDWGSLRYATSAALSAALYYTVTQQPTTKAFAMSQLRYVMGDNPYGRSFVVGWGPQSPQYPHHRNAYGREVHDWVLNELPLHTLSGALVGGPTRTAVGSSQPGYVDEISDHVGNEVALDYNAGLVGLLAFGLSSPAPPLASEDLGGSCTEASDCSQGWCVPSESGAVCTMACVEGGCPLGWACRNLATTGSTPICLPLWTTLCDPCEVDEDCRGGIVGSEARCINHGDKGSFCATECDAGFCPAGYACQAHAESADTLLCHTTGPECQCSPRAIALQLITSCHNTNATGSCPGERSCESDGLTPCDAPEAIDGSCDPPPPPPCLDDPCVHGSCEADGSTFICTCEAGWSGVLCDQAVPTVAITLSTTDVWSDGFNGLFTLQNQSNEALSGWQLNCQVDFDIEDVWNAEWTVEDATYQFSDVGWNAQISVGNAITFGFTANGKLSIHSNVGCTITGVSSSLTLSP